jgi:hypothetical protein
MIAQAGDLPWLWWLDLILILEDHAWRNRNLRDTSVLGRQVGR